MVWAGTALRSLLPGAGLLPCNPGSRLISCRGLVSSGGRGTGDTAGERVPAPPHRGARALRPVRAGSRAGQCVLLPRVDVRVSKLPGFWGHRRLSTKLSEKDEAEPIDALFDYEAIGRYEPRFPPWLRRELRSNHAGETGAVSIYDGALWALSKRAWLSGGGVGCYEKELIGFCEHHAASERAHLVALNRIVLPRHRSVLLPAWRWAGFALGALSAGWCPRGMYVTTDAVETFVEAHYSEQIKRLEEELASTPTAGAEARELAVGKAELVRVLRWACEDEVAHKEEAQLRADDARGGRPWFEWVDPAWQWVVGRGSAAAAELARRI